MRWLRGFMMRRTEDMLRQAMGQPTRSQEQKARRKEQRRQETEKHSRPRATRHPGAMMQRVAEDVQFVEIKEYSKTSLDIDADSRRTLYREEQVEDVKYTEIKSNGKDSVRK